MRATEYLFSNDQLSNGVADIEQDSSAESDDDAKEIKVKMSYTSGRINFSTSGGLSYYTNKRCFVEDKLEIPWKIDDKGPFPDTIYVRAEGVNEQTDSSITMTYMGKSPSGDPLFDSAKIPLTVVKGPGDLDFFNACRDYILENNARFYTTRCNLGGAVLRIVVMLQSKTTFKAVDGFYKTPKVVTMDEVADNFTDYSVATNGLFEDNGRFGQGPPIYQGRLISEGSYDPTHCVDRGPQYYYFAQTPQGAFTFAQGEVPLDKNYGEAMGGADISTNFKYAITTAGEAVAGGDKIIFTAVTEVTKLSAAPGGGSEFLAAITASHASSLYFYDGHSSCAMAHADPSGRLVTDFSGRKHLPVLVPPFYHIHTFLLFKCSTPR